MPSSGSQGPRRILGTAHTVSPRAWFATSVTSNSLHLHILGAVEAEVDGRAIELGGRRQCAVLAALLLRVDEIVADGRLIDDVWGEEPPASAAHTLEAYVSRLRQALTPYGIALERRGGGYRLSLGTATLDARAFEQGIVDATRALEAGDVNRASAQAAEALALWRGPILAATLLYQEGRAAAERLEELRTRALEVHFEAELALGHHSDVVGALRRALDASRYRERLVAQLVVALYRSGRHAEALEVYEQTRRTLDEDLGLQPSADLQRLAGQIVRQEPGLGSSVAVAAPERPAPARTRRRAAAVAFLVALAAAVGTLTLVLLNESGVTQRTPTRVALIRMWNPGGPGGYDEAGWRPFVDGLLAAERKHGIETEFVDLFPHRPPLGGYEPGSPADVARLSTRLKAEKFDLVLWPLGLTGPNFYVVVSQNPETRFVFLDYCCVEGAFNKSHNATSIALRGEQAAHLAGYLSGLLEARRSIPPGGRHTIGVLVAEAGFPQERAWEDGFSDGARRALPDVNLLVGYSNEYDDQNVCERVANQLIDAGARILFVAAGDCGLGAISAAGLRGVSVIAAGEDRSDLGPHVLASATKRFDRLTELSVTWYLEGRLPADADLELGLIDDAVGLVGIRPDVPASVRSKVAVEAARLRAEEASGS